MIKRTVAPIALLAVAASMGTSSISGCSTDAGGNPVTPLPTGDAGTSTGASSSGGTPAAGGAAGTGGASGGNAGNAGSAGKGSGLMPDAKGVCPEHTIKNPMDKLCYCQPQTLTQCANGCGDLMTDPKRCGNCDTMCKDDQACNAGKCDASPTELVPAAMGCGSIHVAVAGDTLYWTDTMHGTINSVPVKGGNATELVKGQMAPTQITVGGSSLYWIESGTKTVMTATTTGMTPTAVAPAAADDIKGLALSADGKTLYYSAAKTVMQTTSAPGGTPKEAGHEDEGFPTSLAVSGNQIAYPADMTGDIDVMTINQAMPTVCASPGKAVMNVNCARLARSQGDLFTDCIYIVGTKAYWLNGLSVYAALLDGTGTNETVALTSNPSSTKNTALVVDAKNAYFADDAGFVYTAPLTHPDGVDPDTIVKTLARNQGAPTSIAVDASNVYWASGDCAIRSLPLK